MYSVFLFMTNLRIIAHILRRFRNLHKDGYHFEHFIMKELFVYLQPDFLRDMEMKAFWTILMLVASNILMTFAWYGQFKLQELKISTDWPLILIILVSWGVAFFEYCVMIPANRIGYVDNGGPFNLVQLKVIQEAISLTVFTIIVTLLFKNQPIHWNHFVSFGLIILAVFFAFVK